MTHLLDRVTRRVAGCGFRYACWYQRWRLHRYQHRSRGVVLVYQMGKVGSATVVRSLRAAAPNLAVHHIHNLRAEKLERFARNTRAAFHRRLVSPLKRQILAERLVTELHLRRQLDRHPTDLNWKIITLVRDPVARNLSSFFEILDIQMNYDLAANLAEKGREVVVAELCEKFLQEYPGHDQPLVFFDQEMKPSLGLDVFATAFPTDRGYAVYRCPVGDVLLLRLEDLDRVAARAFQEFLGLRDFRLLRANVGEQKDYAEVYRDVLEAIQLPSSYLDWMYGSRYAHHFYTTEELARFRSRWSGPSVGA